MGQAQSPHKDVSGKEAIEKIKKLTEKAGNCFFTTKVGHDAHSVPMALQNVDDKGILWFISAKDSTHNQNISEDSIVQLYFQNESSYEYVFIKGEAKISQDQALIDEFYNKFHDAWFEGKHDPRVTVIGVKPLDGYYYETKDNKVFAMAKMAFAAVTGTKNDDGGIEGGLKL